MLAEVIGVAVGVWVSEVGCVIDDHARAGLAERRMDLAGHTDLPGRQVSLARRLLAQMDVHHAGAGVEGCFRLTRHFLRGYRDVMLFRVGQHAVQRAGDDSLVAHGWAFDLLERAISWSWDHASCISPLLASTRYRPDRTGRCGRSQGRGSPRRSRAASGHRTGGSSG